MTEDELEVLRLKVRIVVLESLVHALCTVLARTLPGARQAMLDQFQLFRQKQSQVVLPGFPPEISDMVAGEYQEALDDVLKAAEKYFEQ
jgi:hypothetical protein